MTNTKQAKTRSRPNAEYVLYARGEPVAVNADGDTSYFGTDILGSVRSVTDKYGNVKAQYEYDAFGSPYLANLENDVGFGYCGKVYDSATGLYDYGFRDYVPNSARFTTVDPVRDGSNWFSYCMNDAVNYVDLFGLCGSDITFSSSVFNNPIIGNKFVSNNWIVGDGWATATSGATLNGLTQTTGVPWTTTSWDQSRNPTTLQIGETITWNTSLPFSNLTFSEGSTNTTSIAVTPQTFSQSSSFASSGGSTPSHTSGNIGENTTNYFINDTPYYYVFLPENPKSVYKFYELNEEERSKYIDKMIVAPFSQSEAGFAIDAPINSETRTVRKVATGGVCRAYEDVIDGNLIVLYEATNDGIGALASLYRNITSGKGDYYSKPGAYSKDNYPQDIQDWFIKYPYIEIVIEEANRRKALGE